MLHVRPADPSDAAAVAAILADARMLQVLAEPEALTRQRLRDQIRATEHGAHEVFVAERSPGQDRSAKSDDGAERDEDRGREVVGVVAVNWTHNLRLGVDGLVSDLFVASRARGEGAGTALLDHVKRRASRIGCTRLLLTSGKEGKAYERDFYPKQGFEEHHELACFLAPVKP
ncbi:MAG: GNAT family N-acetyltransferase [Trueperaceae bacterium]